MEYAPKEKINLIALRIAGAATANAKPMRTNTTARRIAAKPPVLLSTGPVGLQHCQARTNATFGPSNVAPV